MRSKRGKDLCSALSSLDGERNPKRDASGPAILNQCAVAHWYTANGPHVRNCGPSILGGFPEKAGQPPARVATAASCTAQRVGLDDL